MIATTSRPPSFVIGGKLGFVGCGKFGRGDAGRSPEPFAGARFATIGRGAGLGAKAVGSPRFVPQSQSPSSSKTWSARIVPFLSLHAGSTIPP